MDLMWGQSDILHHMFEYLFILQIFQKDQTAQCGINHMYTVVSQQMQHMSITQL